MRHQYVVVGLLSVICGLLGYIAAQLTVERPQQVQQQIKTQPTTEQIDEAKQTTYNEKYENECMGIVRAKSKYNAVVKTEFTFDKLGNAQDVKLIQSSGYPDLDADAIIFAKGTRGGEEGKKTCLIQTFSTQSEVEQPPPNYPPPRNIN